MAYYLVTAKLREDLRKDLVEMLNAEEFLSFKPFGIELMKGLSKARIKKGGYAIWEEEDYCVPPLAQERAAVLDKYFDEIEVEDVGTIGKGWEKIEKLPRLLPEAEIYLDPGEEVHYGVPEDEV